MNTRFFIFRTQRHLLCECTGCHRKHVNSESLQDVGSACKSCGKVIRLTAVSVYQERPWYLWWLGRYTMEWMFLTGDQFVWTAEGSVEIPPYFKDNEGEEWRN